jgi:chromosome partitioning protein
MKTIALIAQKGGCGKSTIALSLAVAALQDKAVAVIIDLDPQATACNWGDRRGKDSPVIIDAQPARLPNALAKAADSGVDFAIIDTPARSEQAALAAAKAADLVLIPCRPQVYDLETVPNSRDLVVMAGDKPTLVIFNAVPPRGNRHEEAAQAVQAFGVAACPVTIGNRSAFGDAAALGQTVLEYDPSSKGAEEIRLVYKYISRLLDNTKRGNGDHAAKTKSRRRAG